MQMSPLIRSKHHVPQSQCFRGRGRAVTGKGENRSASEQRSEINLHFVDQSFVERLSQNLPAALNQNTRDFFSS